jgi:hypothetical protein
MEKDPVSPALRAYLERVMQTLDEGSAGGEFPGPPTRPRGGDTCRASCPRTNRHSASKSSHQGHTSPPNTTIAPGHSDLRASGKLATPYCPADEIEEQVFEIYPAEANDWVREQGIPQPPTEYCDVHGPNLANTDIAIVSPRNRASVAGVISITGNARAGGMERFWLEYGEGAEPENWIRLSNDRGDRWTTARLGRDTTTVPAGLDTRRWP